MADAGLCPHCGATLLETGPEAPLGHWYCPYCLGELPAAETLARRSYASPPTDTSRASLAERWSSVVDQAADPFSTPAESLSDPLADSVPSPVSGGLSVERALELARRQSERRGGVVRLVMAVGVGCLLGLAAFAANSYRQKIAAWCDQVSGQAQVVAAAPAASGSASAQASGPAPWTSAAEATSTPLPDPHEPLGTFAETSSIEAPESTANSFPSLSAISADATLDPTDGEPDGDPFTVADGAAEVAQPLPQAKSPENVLPIEKSSPVESRDLDRETRTAAHAALDARPDDASALAEETLEAEKAPRRLPANEGSQALVEDVPCATAGTSGEVCSNGAEGVLPAANAVTTSEPAAEDTEGEPHQPADETTHHTARVPVAPVVTSVGVDIEVQRVGATEPALPHPTPDDFDTSGNLESTEAPELGLKRDPPWPMSELRSALAELQSATACRVCSGTGTVPRPRRGAAHRGGASNAAREALAAAATMPCKACSGYNVRGIQPNVYVQFCRLAEIVTFVEVGPEPAELEAVQLHVGQAVLRATNTREKLNSVGRQASQRLSAASAEPQSGVLLAGTVQDLGTAGELHFVRLVLFGTAKSVTVLSREPAAVEPHERVAILGVVVAEPAKYLTGYQGSADQVVWGGYRLALPAR